MGCVSSKILMRTGSIKEDLRHHSLQKVNGFESMLSSKDAGDQFIALLCTAETVARKLKASKSSSTDLVNPETIDDDHSPDSPVIETINTWELLDGLEEDGEEDSQENPPRPSNSSDGVVRTRSFHTVEEFDAMMAQNPESEQVKDSAEVSEINGRTTDPDAFGGNEVEREPSSIDKEVDESSNDLGLKRKAIAKQLGVLRVPMFEFSKSGSLRDWLMQGGQVFSPESYKTPKFGRFELVAGKGGSEGIVFDPEMVSHFEEAMKQMTDEEESILKLIVDEGIEGGNSRIGDKM